VHHRCVTHRPSLWPIRPLWSTVNRFSEHDRRWHRCGTLDRALM
jgi:hypothetical protein